MSTDSIGSAGRNWANLADWFAAIPATLTEDEVGEVYNDSLFTMTAKMDFSGKTPGAFSIILRAATGQGFADSASGGGFKLDFIQSQGAAFSSSTGYMDPLITLNQAKMSIQGLQFRVTTTNSAAMGSDPGGPTATAFIKNCILDAAGNSAAPNRAALYLSNARAINCLAIQRGNNDSYIVPMQYGGEAINVTAVRPSGLSANGTGFRRGGGTNIVKNCVAFNCTTPFTTSGWDASSNYNCSSDANAPGANSQQSKTYANQFVSTTDDWRLKSGSDCIDHGNTDATNAPADIVGTTRGTTTLGDIGCWEYVAAAADNIYNPTTGVILQAVNRGAFF